MKKRFHVSGDCTYNMVGGREPKIMGTEQAVNLAVCLRFDGQTRDDVMQQIKSLKVGEAFVGRVCIIRLQNGD